MPDLNDELPCLSFKLPSKPQTQSLNPQKSYKRAWKTTNITYFGGSLVLLRYSMPQNPILTIKGPILHL